MMNNNTRNDKSLKILFNIIIYFDFNISYFNYFCVYIFNILTKFKIQYFLYNKNILLSRVLGCYTHILKINPSIILENYPWLSLKMNPPTYIATRTRLVPGDADASAVYGSIVAR